MNEVMRFYDQPDGKFAYAVRVWDDGYHKAQWIITEYRVARDGQTASLTGLTLNFSKEPTANDWPTILNWFEGKNAERLSAS